MSLRGLSYGEDFEYTISRTIELLVSVRVKGFHTASVESGHPPRCLTSLEQGVITARSFYPTGSRVMNCRDIWQLTQYEIDSHLAVPHPVARNTRINSIYADIYRNNEDLYWP